MLAARTRSGSSVSEDVPPKKSARTSANPFVATVVIEHQKTLVRDDFVFIEQLLGAGKIPLGIDMLDINLSFTGILIFRQQILNVRGNRRVGRKENGDAHLALERVEETLRFI